MRTLLNQSKSCREVVERLEQGAQHPTMIATDSASLMLENGKRLGCSFVPLTVIVTGGAHGAQRTSKFF